MLIKVAILFKHGQIWLIVGPIPIKVLLDQSRLFCHNFEVLFIITAYFSIYKRDYTVLLAYDLQLTIFDHV